MVRDVNKPKQRRKGPAAAVYDLEVEASEEEDFEDDFKAGKDRVSLRPRAEEGSDLDLDEDGVYNLDEDEDEDEDEDLEEEELLEEAEAKGGKLAQLARQAKYLGESLKKQRALEEEEEEDQEGGQAGPDKEGLLAWGANKRAYYDADEASSEEDAEAEEQEAARLQALQAAQLDPEDYGLELGALLGAAAGSGSGATAAARPGAAAAAAGRRGGFVEVEEVAKDLGALTSDEQMSVLMSDAPELLGLLEELAGALQEVRHKVGPLLAEVRAGGLATAGGLSYLEAKHLLLLQYCSCLVVYLLLKAEGRPVRDHPVIGRLVQLRTYLERVRPIDRQLAYQVDKLLRATAIAQAEAAAVAAGAEGGDQQQQEGGAADELLHRPNPAALVAKAPLVAPSEQAAAGGGGDGGDGLYRPPRLNPTAMEEDLELSRQERRRLREAARKAKRSSLVSQLAAELAGAPEEEGTGGGASGLADSAAAVAASQRLAAREAAEEELMVRVPLSKVEAKRLKALHRAGLSGHGVLEDFADEVTDLVASASAPAAAAAGGGSGPSGLSDLFSRQRLSQKFGADLLQQTAAAGRPSGDADLPQRAPLGERRAAYDAVAARRAAAAGGEEGPDEMEGVNDEFFGGGGGSRKRARGGEQDEFYTEAAAAREGTKAARKQKYMAADLAPPLPDPEVSGQRKINTAIQKNRGLTPHRRKDLKNPRKKNRIKFAQASVRRKGQVQGVRPAQAAGYGGEATGIKAKLAKSTRLG